MKIIKPGKVKTVRLTLPPTRERCANSSDSRSLPLCSGAFGIYTASAQGGYTMHIYTTPYLSGTAHGVTFREGTKREILVKSLR